jgi:hypothetical protein
VARLPGPEDERFAMAEEKERPAAMSVNVFELIGRVVKL